MKGIKEINPTFEEYFNSLNVKAYGELKGQYKHLWKLYCTKMKSCYSEHSCSMFEAWRMAGNKTMDIGWGTKFICPFTSKPMRVATPFVGDYYWAPRRRIVVQVEATNSKGDIIQQDTIKI